MELKREQVEKALDWLDSLVGNSNDSEIALFTYQLLGILYDTCEELTEENERLRAENERLKARVLEENHLRRQAEEMLANGMNALKADTVRKMKEIIAEHATNGFPRKVRLDDVNKIAKEMLGE